MKEEIKLVQQEDSCGCVIACIAMVLGKTYQEIAGYFTDDERYRKGVNWERQLEVMAGFNIKWRFITPPEDTLYGHVYMVTVPSLNTLSGNHAVVFDFQDEETARVLDPQNGVEGKKYYNYGTSSIMSFTEVLKVWVPKIYQNDGKCELGKRLEEYRIENNLNRKIMCRYLGISDNGYRNTILGKSKPNKKALIRKIEKLIGEI